MSKPIRTVAQHIDITEGVTTLLMLGWRMGPSSFTALPTMQACFAVEPQAGEWGAMLPYIDIRHGSDVVFRAWPHVPVHFRSHRHNSIQRARYTAELFNELATQVLPHPPEEWVGRILRNRKLSSALDSHDVRRLQDISIRRIHDDNT